MSAPNLQDYLNAASAVYNQSTTTAPLGWTLLETSDADKKVSDGFFAQAYKDNSSGNVIVAFEGTDDNLQGSKDADLQIVLG
jgi:hypothetical protein